MELHHPGGPCSPERVQALLHAEFHEVGRSGRAYTRATVVAYLAAQPAPPAVVSDGFAVAELAPGLALLTYRSAQREPDGALANHTLRASLWQQGPAGWQLRYHQGTPAATPWSLQARPATP